jgi:hypothetical protein
MHMCVIRGRLDPPGLDEAGNLGQICTRPSGGNRAFRAM